MPFPLAQVSRFKGPVSLCGAAGGLGPHPLLPLPLWCPSSRGPGRATGGRVSAPTPYPFFSSWEAPLAASELNQQEECRARAELAPGTPSPAGQGSGGPACCPCVHPAPGSVLRPELLLTPPS